MLDKIGGLDNQQGSSEEKFIVYKLTNRNNGKCYIGISSRTLPVRWSEHCGRAKQGLRNSRLYSAIRLYGPDAFDQEIIATSSSEDGVRELEKKYIIEHDSFNSGYNCNEGGCGNLIIPQEVIDKISASQKGKVVPFETRARMSARKSW